MPRKVPLPTPGVLGGHYGSETHTLTQAQMPTHDNGASAAANGGHNHGWANSAWGYNHGGGTGDQSASHAHSYARAGTSVTVAAGTTATIASTAGGTMGTASADHSHGIGSDGAHTHTIDAVADHSHAISIGNAGGKCPPDRASDAGPELSDKSLVVSCRRTPPHPTPKREVETCPIPTSPKPGRRPRCPGPSPRSSRPRPPKRSAGTSRSSRTRGGGSRLLRPVPPIEGPPPVEDEGPWLSLGTSRRFGWTSSRATAPSTGPSSRAEG